MKLNLCLPFLGLLGACAAASATPLPDGSYAGSLACSSTGAQNLADFTVPINVTASKGEATWRRSNGADRETLKGLYASSTLKFSGLGGAISPLTIQVQLDWRTDVELQEEAAGLAGVATISSKDGSLKRYTCKVSVAVPAMAGTRPAPQAALGATAAPRDLQLAQATISEEERLRRLKEQVAQEERTVAALRDEQAKIRRERAEAKGAEEKQRARQLEDRQRTAEAQRAAEAQRTGEVRRVQEQAQAQKRQQEEAAKQQPTPVIAPPAVQAKTQPGMLNFFDLKLGQPFSGSCPPSTTLYPTVKQGTFKCITEAPNFIQGVATRNTVISYEGNKISAIAAKFWRYMSDTEQAAVRSAVVKIYGAPEAERFRYRWDSWHPGRTSTLWLHPEAITLTNEVL